jgi:hypothetical protein
MARRLLLFSLRLSAGVLMRAGIRFSSASMANSLLKLETTLESGGQGLHTYADFQTQLCEFIEVLKGRVALYALC